MTKKEFKKIRESFFNTMFILLGCIANCDGYINRKELKRTRVYMEKMKLSEECKHKAIRLFRIGASPAFNITATLEGFKEAAAKSQQTTELLLVYLISVARVDGLMVDKEIKLVKRVASALGYSSLVFEHLLRMISAQEHIYNSTQNTSSRANDRGKNQHDTTGSQSQPNSLTAEESAYQALGLARGADSAEVKKAYRKLVSQYHPDKIQGQGLPAEFIQAANDYFKRIQAAFEYINHH